MTAWTVAHQEPLSTEFSKQEHWSGLPFPSPRDLPNPGIKPGSPALQSDSLLSESPGEWGAPTTGHQGSPDSSSFNFLKNHHTVFHSSPELFLIFALIHLTHKSSFLREEENRKEKARQWEPLSGYSLLLHWTPQLPTYSTASLFCSLPFFPVTGCPIFPFPSGRQNHGSQIKCPHSNPWTLQM